MPLPDAVLTLWDTSPPLVMLSPIVRLVVQWLRTAIFVRHSEVHSVYDPRHAVKTKPHHKYNVFCAAHGQPPSNETPVMQHERL